MRVSNIRPHRYPLYNLMGMSGHAPPVFARRRISEPAQLLLGRTSHKRDSTLSLPSPWRVSSRHQRCALISRNRRSALGVGHRDVLDEASRVQRAERPERSRSPRRTSRSLVAWFSSHRRNPESRNGDRHRSTLPLVDVDPQFGAGRRDRNGAGAQNSVIRRTNITPFLS